VAKYCDEHLCMSVSVCEHISRTICAILAVFLCMLPMAVAWSSFGRVTKQQGEGQFWGLSGPFKSNGYLRCSRCCRVRCKRAIQSPMTSCSRRDHSVCQASTNRNLKKFRVQAMQPTGRRGVMGVHCAQRWQSDIYDCIFCSRST